MVFALSAKNVKKAVRTFFLNVTSDYSFFVISELIPGLKNHLMRPNIFQIFELMSDTTSPVADYKNVYRLLTCCTIYHVWRERNERNFGSHIQSSSSIHFLMKKALSFMVSRWRNGKFLMDMGII
ncbi:hypothetical protein IEQ34_008188 [Dendrobium chrysotoxum]|uniref:Uncharacterized protein n=1 Tax=Dendrobium chrysotoxum TaxID=161865 RepID=A0AAV7H3E9_DENCH|nr:hypothetical protein IEQ34_008188 [Dendrobium chrysotoxum]